MCKEVAILKADGSADYVCNKGEIEQRMGGPVPGMENSQDNGCLCPMDEEATAKLYGYSISVGWDSHGVDIVMTPNVPHEGRQAGSSPGVPLDAVVGGSRERIGDGHVQDSNFLA